MDYFINPQSLSSVFTVPSAVVDRYFKLAKAEHIKVLLYVLRNMSDELTQSQISDGTGVDEYEVSESLLYWADAGILLPKNEIKSPEKPARNVVSKSEKPTRNDAVRRGLEDEKIKYLLHEAQIKFARNLKSNEVSTLVWLYDDEGLDVSLILLIIQYAVAHKKANIRFIESVAVSWIENGIDSVAAADEQLKQMALGEQAWAVVSSAFGLERRKPSQKETELSVKWVDEWKMTKEMLEQAYDECVNQKSKFSFPYVAKIIENRHNDGNYAESGKKSKKSNDGNFASYDIDLYEKMLNSKD